jgi:hypothetical protein
MPTSLLADWTNFYVITGSAAAGLTGLTFVVIALASDAQRASTAGLRAFVTPTIVHFGAVLTLAAFLNMPRLSVLNLSIGFGAAGIAGLIYLGIIAARMIEVAKNYVPVLEDWLGHTILPALAYGALVAVAFTIARSPESSLYVVAAASLLLLFVGIHNCWDVAVWNTTKKERAARSESWK